MQLATPTASDYIYLRVTPCATLPPTPPPSSSLSYFLATLAISTRFAPPSIFHQSTSILSNPEPLTLHPLYHGDGTFLPLPPRLSPPLPPPPPLLTLGSPPPTLPNPSNPPNFPPPDNRRLPSRPWHVSLRYPEHNNREVGPADHLPRARDDRQPIHYYLG